MAAHIGLPGAVTVVGKAKFHCRRPAAELGGGNFRHLIHGKTGDIRAGALVKILLGGGTGVDPPIVLIQGMGAQDLFRGQVEVYVGRLAAAVVPGGVQMIVAPAHRHHIPHMGGVFVVEAGDQGAGDIHPVQEQLHGPGIPLAYCPSLHQRTVGGKSVGIPGYGIVQGGGFLRIGTGLHQLVVIKQLRFKVSGRKPLVPVFGVPLGQQRFQLFGGGGALRGIHAVYQTESVVIIRAAGAVPLVAIEIGDEKKLGIVPRKGVEQLLGLLPGMDRLGKIDFQARIGVLLAGFAVRNDYGFVPSV